MSVEYSAPGFCLFAPGISIARLLSMIKNQVSSEYNLLMLSGDSSIARGIDGAFHQMLTRFSRYWNRIDILTPSAPDASESTIHGNVYVHPAKKHRLLQPFFIKQKGEALLKERDYHLVTSHDFGFFYNGIGASWLLREKDIPLVSEIHHIEGYPIASTTREKLWRWSARQYIPFIAKQGAYFRVVNQYVAEQLIQFGADAEKIRTLYSVYLDLDLYRPQAIEKEYDVLFVARLAPNKGIMMLLDAIRQVKQTHPDIRLAIRGEGILKGQIEQYNLTHSLQKNVLFLPRVGDSSQMPELYNKTKILVCSSTVEGNPRVTIEAMACATPVVSTRVGIMPEVIQHGENGLLVDWNAGEMADAILQLLDDSVFYLKVAQAGQASVQRFEAEKIIQGYAESYREIIENHI